MVEEKKKKGGGGRRGGAPRNLILKNQSNKRRVIPADKMYVSLYLYRAMFFYKEKKKQNKPSKNNIYR